MYYVWDQNTKLVGEYAFFGEKPEGYDLITWTSGEKLSQDPPQFVIKTDEESSTSLTDLLLTQFDMHIFSPRLIQLFQEMGIENIDYYPIKIINHETGDIDDTYRAAYIVGKIECLDTANSECIYSRRGDKLLDLSKFKIFEEKINSAHGFQNKPHIFRLAEFTQIVLIDDSLKDRMEQEGIIGGRFIKPEEYIS